MIKLSIVLFLSISVAVRLYDVTDRGVVNGLCGLEGVNKTDPKRYKQLLPRLRRRFACYADVVAGRKQKWKKFTTDQELIEQVRLNVMPRHFDHRQARVWLANYTRKLYIIGEK